MIQLPSLFSAQPAAQDPRDKRDRGINQQYVQNITILVDHPVEEVKHRLQKFGSSHGSPYALTTRVTGSTVFPSANIARRFSYSPREGNSTLALRA